MQLGGYNPPAASSKNPVLQHSKYDPGAIQNNVTPSNTLESKIRGCGNCTRSSDNRYFDCPPRMSDGRLFTDYRPRCELNYVGNNGQGKGMDSYSYRQFLLSNTDNILADMRKQIYDSVVCGPCEEPYNIGTMLPEKVLDVCNKRTCSRKTVGSGDGLGMGRYYGMDKVGDEFTTGKIKEQSEMKSRGANCCGTVDENSEYFPPYGMNVGPSIGRVASPYGGVPLHGGDSSIALQSTVF